MIFGNLLQEGDEVLDTRLVPPPEDLIAAIDCAVSDLEARSVWLEERDLGPKTVFGAPEPRVFSPVPQAWTPGKALFQIDRRRIALVVFIILLLDVLVLSVVCATEPRVDLLQGGLQYRDRQVSVSGRAPQIEQRREMSDNNP